MAKKKKNIEIFTISVFNVEEDMYEDGLDSATYEIYESEEDAISSIRELQKKYGEEYDFYINYGEYYDDNKNIVGDPQPFLIERLYEDGGYVNDSKKENRIKDCVYNNEISISDLCEVIGKEPNYPFEIVGSIKLEKCFLRPYYRCINN